MSKEKRREREERTENEGDGLGRRERGEIKRPTHFVRRNTYDDAITEEHRQNAGVSSYGYRQKEISNNFWDFRKQPMSLNIYASGRAFVAGGMILTIT